MAEFNHDNDLLASGSAQDEREQRIKSCLAEIEQAIKNEFMVEDRSDSSSVYMVAADFKAGEFVSIPKTDVAEMFADDNEIYSSWKSSYDEYLKKRAARSNIKPIFGFSKKKNEGDA